MIIFYLSITCRKQYIFRDLLSPDWNSACFENFLLLLWNRCYQSRSENWLILLWSSFFITFCFSSCNVGRNNSSCCRLLIAISLCSYSCFFVAIFRGIGVKTWMIPWKLPCRAHHRWSSFSWFVLFRVSFIMCFLFDVISSCKYVILEFFFRFDVCKIINLYFPFSVHFCLFSFNVDSPSTYLVD